MSAANWVAKLGVTTRGEASPASARDRIGTDHPGHVGKLSHLGQSRGNSYLCRPVGQISLPGIEDDLVGVAGLGWKVTFEQVSGPLRVGPVQREAVDVVGTNG